MKEKQFYAAMYLRLSKDDEDRGSFNKSESNSIGNQRELIKSFLREQPDIELYDIYVEMKIAYLIQRARIEYRENRRNKGFRHNERVRELLFL